ncbi:MAG TPA: hypothetical protein VH325_00785 [Bryobacteraceae bacterium]|nr:hypothetical protein [Bryobacteraceae bacterium]
MPPDSKFLWQSTHSRITGEESRKRDEVRAMLAMHKMILLD